MNNYPYKNITETTLKNYASLFVRTGGNVQKGQPVIINSNIEASHFAHLVEEAAYDAGASQVSILWSSDASVRTRYFRAADEVFDEFPDWMVERFEYWDKKGAVYLHIASSDPDLLNGADPDRIRRLGIISSKKTKPHADRTMSYKLRWSICAVPSKGWAAKVFPDLPVDKAVEKLWELIIKASRADGDNPIEDWKKHRQSFVDRVNYLNEQQFSKLRITTGLGTDITLGLPKNHIWKGGGSYDKDGLPFSPNIPTEEIYTAPDRNVADGRVVASMPLSYRSSLIEGIELIFRDGVIVDYKAVSNQEALANIIETDEGAKRLGEIALVPKSSPITQMNTLFYNTLYDENASCHMAIGKAYPINIEGGADLSIDELAAKGINNSLVHVDFMFGTDDMSVVGIYDDGGEVVVFGDGEYKG